MQKMCLIQKQSFTKIALRYKCEKTAITDKVQMRGVANYSDCLFCNDIVKNCLRSSDKEKTTM